MSNVFRQIKNKKTLVFAAILVEFLVLFQGIYCYSYIVHSKTVMFITGFSLVFAAVGFFALIIKRESAKLFRRLFLSFILLLGCFYAVIFPPNSVPDEMFHFQCSYKYSDLILGEKATSDELTIRNEDKVLFQDQRIKVSLTHYNDVLENMTVHDKEGTTTVKPYSSFDIASNPPQVKIASALGITIGKILNLDAYPLYYLGRLFNLLSFVLLVYFAVRLTPVGKNIFMAVALLPMTLHLAASYSYDVALIGMTFLLTALCLKAIYEKGRIQKRLLVGIGILVFLIAPCKVIYSAVAGLILFIPKERFSSRKVCIAVKGGLLLLAVASIMTIRLSSIISLSGISSTGAGGDGLNHRGAETGNFFTLSDVLADSIHVFMMYIATFGVLGSWLIETSIGGSLGWFQEEIIAPDILVYSFVVILLIASLKSADNDRELPKLLRGAYVVIVIGVCVLVGASMLLGHTFVTETYIMGIQGRYVLPVAPLLLLALQNSKIVYNGNPASVVLIGSLALNMMYLTYVLSVALTLG